jgi:hypothetical protein
MCRDVGGQRGCLGELRRGRGGIKKETDGGESYKVVGELGTVSFGARRALFQEGSSATCAQGEDEHYESGNNVYQGSILCVDKR